MTPDSTLESTQSNTQEPAFAQESPSAKAPGKRSKAPKQPWTPPKGIRYEYRADRPAMPFYLHWRDPSGQRHKQAFKDESSREIVAKDLAQKREREGTSILSFSPERWRIYEAFQRIVGPDVDPLQVAREWKSTQGVGKAAPTLTVSAAIERYIALREAEGGVDAAYLSHVRMHLRKSFGARVGHVLLHELDAAMLREWLANLRGRDRKTGQPMVLGVEARRHYYRTVSTFLTRCVTEQWIKTSPCDVVAAPAPTKEELAKSEVIKLMPVGDVEKLFRSNRGYRVVGRLALEAFGGVRYTTASLMKEEHIDFERLGLAMPGHIHKSRKRKFRQGHPECLWAWLRHAPKDCWTMSEDDYYNEKRDAFIRAEVRNPGNGLRHSFASYLLAVTKNLPLVSYLMQHAKTTMTEKYEGRASEQDGKRYVAITPASVAT